MNLRRWAATAVMGGALSLGGSFPAWGDDIAPQIGPPSPSPLAIEPSTPEELFEATLFMLKLGKTDLAKYYIDQLIAADPDDLTLLRIRDRHDTATFLELQRVDEIAQPAARLAARLQEATRNHVSDAGYFPGILSKLSAGGRREAEAIDELRYLGPAAVPLLINELQKPVGTDKGLIVYALTRLGRNANEPLLGALRSPVPDVRAAAATVLGLTASKEEIPWLQRMAFSPNEQGSCRQAAVEALARLQFGDPQQTARISDFGVSDRLTRLAQSFLTGKYKWPTNLREDGKRSVWSWDAAAGTVRETLTTERYASLYWAEQFARDAAELRPAAKEPSVILLATLMTRDIEQAGWDQPIPLGPGTAMELAVTSGPAHCAEILQFAQSEGLVAPQLACLEALALNGSEKLLTGRAAGVVRALNSSDPRVQYTAATTILAWNPQQPYQGSGRVVEILARALAGDAAPQSVVIDPNGTRASTTVGTFSDVGWRGTPVRTGMEGFEHAVSHGNIQLAVVHPNTIRWELTDTIANFRNDSRTAQLPIVIFGPPELEPKLAWLTKRYDRVTYIYETPDTLDVSRQLRAFLAQASPPDLSQAERAAQIRDAAYWLARLAEAPAGVYDLQPAETALLSVLDDPELAEYALQAVTVIPGRTVQQRLVQSATDVNLSNAQRRRAALSLANHLHRFGNQLPQPEWQQVLAQSTAANDPVLQTTLQAVIGALEPSSPAVRKRIIDSPRTAAPISK
jgi:HEAT repeat protein